MVFVKPAIPSDTQKYDAADWIELRAIESENNKFNFVKIFRMIDLLDEEDDRSTDDEETEDFKYIQEWLDELQYREKILGASYPFIIHEKYIEYIPIEDVSGEKKYGSITYLLCLLFSHSKNSLILEGEVLINFQAVGKGKDRDHFQTCSNLAAAGYLQGSSVSFGWPRKNSSNYLKALKKLVNRVLDGAVLRAQPTSLAPRMVKDFELDLVSWIPTNDDLPGKVIMIGQVATGIHWEEKAILNTQLADVREYWLEQPFASDANLISAMFVPFCLIHDRKHTLENWIFNLVRIRMKNLIFYRYRVPYYVQHFFNIYDSENTYYKDNNYIERVSDFEAVKDWVSEKINLIKETNGQVN